MANNQKSEFVKVGVLWEGTSKAGNRYVKGVVEVNGKSQNFVGFLNRDKKDPQKSPDFVLYESEGNNRPASSATNQQARPSTPQAAPAPTPEPAVATEGDEIPL